MGVMFKIALRNLRLNIKKSALIGIAIFISSFLLIIVNSALNGVEHQVIDSYITYQSGEIDIIWKDLKNVNSGDTGKFITYNFSYKAENQRDNYKAIETLNDFLDKNKDKIKYECPTIKRNVTIMKDDSYDYVIAYGITDDAQKQMEDSGIFSVIKGDLVSNKEDGICISEEKAKSLDVGIGSKLKIMIVNDNGESSYKDFEVTGIYANGATYDNSYGFISEDNAKKIFAVKDGYFDIYKLYLNHRDDAKKLSSQLDKKLLQRSNVLRAEDYLKASTIFVSTASNYRIMVTVFIIFFLILIAIGLYSSISMTLYQRMKEFGTLRAIGYSKFKCYFVIQMEILSLCVISLIISLAVAGIIIVSIGSAGIYMGSGVVTYGLGGEKLYFVLKIKDVLVTSGILFLFSIIVTILPGRKLLCMKISDMIEKRLSNK